MLDTKLFKSQHYINGKWLGKPVLEVTNPSTDEVIGKVAAGTATETNEAIAAAHTAFIKWRDVPALERARLLRSWGDLMLQNQDSLAHIMTLEQGKPFGEAKGEIAYAASFIHWFSGEAIRISGLVMNDSTKKILTLRQPVGVCAVITPWNFPAAMITRKLAPALAAGCTAVVRPASQTPFSALALAELAHQAGIPKGVVNILTGSAEPIGEAMMASNTVRKFSFTGSTGVGRLLMAKAAATIKNLSLELGGNAPFIVLEDANLTKAVDEAIVSKFRNAGQTCVCADRFLVHKAIYKEFCQRLTEKTKALRVGDGFEKGVEVGPLISSEAVTQTHQAVTKALSQGAKLLCGGEKLGGNFYAPTVLADCTSQMAVMENENFAPVAPVMAFESSDEAIRLANNSPLGLASYLCGNNLSEVLRVAERIEAGIVGVNSGIISDAVAPFGGVKQSGLGREGGFEGLDAYLETKYIRLSP